MRSTCKPCGLVEIYDEKPTFFYTKPNGYVWPKCCKCQNRESYARREGVPTQAQVDEENSYKIAGQIHGLLMPHAGEAKLRQWI